MASPGTVKTVLDKIIEAKTPERFTQDFLETKLGAKGGSARPIIPLLKRIGFLQQDGSTTELYRKFRNTSTSKAAMAKAIKHGYAELFERNEYAYELPKPKLLELIGEVSGAEKGNSADALTASTFLNLKEYADFEDDLEMDDTAEVAQVNISQNLPASNHHTPMEQTVATQQGGTPLNLSYTINLNLPETDDIKVFNAIFQSLNENILKRN
ncbi:DUF5343 domain-containing protein [Silicimonas algicola]|nr:DUF5343 domain-containing protein [Silicimonas algicola]